MAFRFYGKEGAAPAQAVAEPLAPAAPPTQRPTVDMPPDLLAGYKAWCAEASVQPSYWVTAAFAAGAQWARGQGLGQETEAVEEAAASPAGGGWALYLAGPDLEPREDLDPPTLQTILAALAFYRDNHLSYGPLPGQLTAEQVTELIARLQPEETSL